MAWTAKAREAALEARRKNSRVHVNLVTSALRSWEGSPHAIRSDMYKLSVGERPRLRKDMAKALALQYELRKNSQTNARTLYRGGTTKKHSSWSEKRSVAERFARLHKVPLLSAPKGSVRGIKISDYVKSGFGHEQEWIAESVGKVRTLKTKGKRA